MSKANNNGEEDPIADLLSDAAIEKGYPISRATIARQRKLGRFPQGVRVGRKRLTWRSQVREYFAPKG
ncbi:helix-turn-helix transcriptional regulator [Bosea sp. LjRoot237]|uniref:helix-turn-helix transcriptional regulator n=1 Tax=Bosea sp. LjRoot237 TaxID=3342292 RepID=UPI003ECEB9AE